MFERADLMLTGLATAIPAFTSHQLGEQAPVSGDLLEQFDGPLQPFGERDCCSFFTGSGSI